MMEKSFLDRPLCLLCLAAAQEITRAAPTHLTGTVSGRPLTVPVRRVACKGGLALCFNPSRRVARLAGAPSFHVNRPLNTGIFNLYSTYHVLCLISHYLSFRIIVRFLTSVSSAITRLHNLTNHQLLLLVFF